MHTPLTKELRNQLEKAVVKARDIAEQAAIEELVRLSVGDKAAATYLSPDQKQLRNRLRVHGRALGDRRKPTGEQSINHLVSEAAYEHWHRMLFARFLAENNLLMYEDGVTALSIQDCFDLAEDETGDSANGWQYAAKFATRMLPEVFRVDSPVFDVLLAPNYQKQLEQLLSGLEARTFQASDSLGWVYQFWQSKKKEEVNASGSKIGADELPSVTQLFTEDYMVDFLLDNTLGAWHAGKILDANPQLAESAESEDELRNAVALPDCFWSYLRFIKDEGGKWTPAAGTFDGWPKSAKDLKCLDPCMGSGHFVVAMFERLVALRMAEEKLDEKVIVPAVIQDNLFGLEIDPRCTQIGAFNLALSAWRRVGYCILPALNLACSGFSPNVKKEDWVALAGESDRLQRGMAQLHDLFQDAPVLGSLINPRANGEDLLDAEFHELQPLLEKALVKETEDDTMHEMAVTARGLSKAAEILADHFTLIVTNVPFLGRGKQTSVLQEYCERKHAAAKSDLATCFVERCQEFCSLGGSTSLVTPQNWFFLFTYKSLRRNYIDQVNISLVAELGARAFQTPLYDFSFALLIATNSESSRRSHYSSLVASEFKSIDEKINVLCNAACVEIGTNSVRSQDDCRILTHLLEEGMMPLSVIAAPNTGLQTNDNDFFCHFFWESPTLLTGWEYFQRTGQQTIHFGGRELVLLYEGGNGKLRGLTAAQDRDRRTDMRGVNAWGKYGVLVHRMGNLPATAYTGELFDQNGAAIIPLNEAHLPALWCFLSSDRYRMEVRKLDNKVGVTPATLAKVPFDLMHWQKVAEEKYPHGLPKPFSSDPTQWLFNGHPIGADQPLHVAMARLLGYQWPRQTGSSFPECSELGSDGLELLSDDDGIVCLPAVRGEEAAHEQLEKLLQAAYGNEWSTKTRDQLLKVVDCENHNLEFWLREKFFEQHCKLFKHRPFVWHVWDGLKDGFSTLVNYHKLDKKNLERLIYTYLDDWIRTQKHAANEGVDGADVRMHAAEGLKRRLESILQGEQPYDIFVRWKPLEEQPIGWNPDFNDGVRMNIRPFMMVDDVGKKGAGILRTKPNIKWGKDRGKDPTSAPWFHEFGGDRINDYHLSLAEKQAAGDSLKS